MLHIEKCRATAEERAYLALTRARAQGGLNFTNIVKCTIPVEHMVKVRDFGHVYNDGKVRLQICSITIRVGKTRKVWLGQNFRTGQNAFCSLQNCR